MDLCWGHTAGFPQGEWNNARPTSNLYEIPHFNDKKIIEDPAPDDQFDATAEGNKLFPQGTHDDSEGQPSNGLGA